jgi:D-aspartate ligase
VKIENVNATHLPPAVVLNTHHTGLGIARNLGPLGIRVIGLTAHASFPGNRSRWLEYRPSADSLLAPEALRDQLLRLSIELGTSLVLFPTRDHDIVFINRHRSELQDRFLIPFAEPAVIDAVMNKDRLFEIARTVGISVPETVAVNRPEDRVKARDLRYPCVCKPVYASQWRKPGIWEAVGRQKAVKLDSYAQFEAFYERVVGFDPVVTVQQWVPGEEEDLLIFGSYCNRSSEVVAFFTARKRIQIPPLMGTGVIVEALPIERLREPSAALLKAARFFGISEIEFKRDPRDDRIYLIELNPRHWDQHRLGAVAGVNLSQVAYVDAIDRPIPRMTQSSGSIAWVAEAEFARHAARAMLGRAPLSDLGKFAAPRRTFSVFDASDLRPFWHLIRNAWRR